MRRTDLHDFPFNVYLISFMTKACYQPFVNTIICTKIRTSSVASVCKFDWERRQLNHTMYRAFSQAEYQNMQFRTLLFTSNKTHIFFMT